MLAHLASSREQGAAPEAAEAEAEAAVGGAVGAAVGAQGAEGSAAAAAAAAAAASCPSDGGHMVVAPPLSLVRQASDTDSAKTGADGGSGSTDTAATLSCDGGAGGGAGAADGGADGAADGVAAVALGRAAAASVKEGGSPPPHPSSASSAVPRQVRQQYVSSEAVVSE